MYQGCGVVKNSYNSDSNSNLMRFAMPAADAPFVLIVPFILQKLLTSSISEPITMESLRIKNTIYNFDF